MSIPNDSQSDEQREESAKQALACMVCYEKWKPHFFCNTSEPFARFTSSLNPFLLPCFTFESLERNCLKVYRKEHDKVKEVLSKHGGQISLSADLLMHEERWVSFDEYLCLSAHFIDDNWNLQKWVIKYCCVSGPDSDLSHDAILKSLKEYDIEGKVSSLIVGGKSDLAEYVREHIPERKFPLDGRLFRVQCIGDVISRMVKKGFKEIDEIIDKVQLLSWSKSLPLWYLTSFKLSEAIKLNDLGEFSPEVVDDSFEVPSKEEWEKVKSICKIADKIYEITKPLFDIKRPTANLFLPYLQEIRAYIGQESTNSDAFTRHVALKMLKFFNRHWDDMCLVLSIAAFLDPRFKMNFVEFCLCDESRANSVLSNICELYDGYTEESDHKEYLLSNTYTNESDSEEEEDEDEEGADEKQAKKKSCTVLGNLNVIQKYCESMQSMYYKPKKTGLVKLDEYMEEPVLPWVEEDFSVLQWWKENSSKYPQLSKMARDFLAIPMSVATSYEAYYTEPREADVTLLGLEPELMNALKCTRSWKLGDWRNV